MFNGLCVEEFSRLASIYLPNRMGEMMYIRGTRRCQIKSASLLESNTVRTCEQYLFVYVMKRGEEEEERQTKGSFFPKVKLGLDTNFFVFPRLQTVTYRD